MRPFPLAVLLLAFALVLAGCATPGAKIDTAAGGSPESEPGAPTPTSPGAKPTSPNSPTPPPPQNDSGGKPEDPTFCQSKDGCKFWDEDYHEYRLYDVDTSVVDVLIVPSASADTTMDTPTIKKAILAWSDGIKAMGAPWFASGFKMNVYVLGTDTPPQEALDDPEIVVVAAEYNPVVLFGIGLQLPDTPCRGAATKAYPVHEHSGMRVLAAECAKGGLTCVALNTDFLTGTQFQLYDLVAHEFGHCLAGGHVGDALDFSAKRVPVHDIMSYQSDPAQVHCVSNLNIRVLETAYGPLLGVTPDPPLTAGEYYTMPRADYRILACANP